MKIKRLQEFVSRSSGRLVKVTKVVRRRFDSPKYSQYMICNIEDGKLVKSTSRIIFSDSLRRRYIAC